MSIFNDLAEQEQYNPQDWDTEVVLVESSVDLLCESIVKQFKNPLELGMNDFIQSFITKYTLAKKVDEEESQNAWEDDETETASKLYDRFMNRVLKIFSEQLDLEIPEIDDMSEVDQLTMVHYIYLYFVNHMKHNILNYLRNYVKNRKEVIEAKFEMPENTGYYQEFITDDFDRLLVLRSMDIAEYAMKDEGVSCEDFLAWTMDDEADLENEFVLSHYKECDIVGNFRKKYAKLADIYIVPISCIFQREITTKYHKTYDDATQEEAFERLKKAALEADAAEAEDAEVQEEVAKEAAASVSENDE